MPRMIIPPEEVKRIKQSRRPGRVVGRRPPITKPPTTPPVPLPKTKAPVDSGVTPKDGGRPPVTKPKPPTKGKKPGQKRPGRATPSQAPVNVGLGFDAKQMAKTLTNLGYSADIKAIQTAIRENAQQELAALANLRDWSAQVEAQRAQGAAAIGNVWTEAAAQAGQNVGNIANLFGEQAAGEFQSGQLPGMNLLAGLGASDKAFFASMGPILAAQGQDYARRAQSEFGAQRRELQQQLTQTQQERGAAFNENLIKMMQLQWDREQQLFDRQLQLRQADLAEAAARQAGVQGKIDIQRGKQDIRRGEQEIEMNEIQRQQALIQLQAAQVELDKLQQTPTGGFDWSNPQTGAQVGNAAMTGAVGPQGAFVLNPRIAWENVVNILAQYGAQNDPRAMEAAWNAFVTHLRISHARKRWGQYRIKGGKLVYNPAWKFKKRKTIPQTETPFGG